MANIQNIIDVNSMDCVPEICLVLEEVGICERKLQFGESAKDDPFNAAG